ncbi:MAG: spheroidene monooxygenase [Bacteroidetes bacterium 24-39-8]|nr:MAG: spheroidene monooxygenase [Sphingobacteriia bacterium 35-40-8]OYZ50952.1 MAG: spheroidene monooxygenase [Bacteroidetes bacterium 24-39-8]OZA63450.1 MAG: spheroidene monooxygenase [Sphingobacteriia bacterium 39-39-8]HQR93631.1 spheroidene monooxygenase [Sediminibacterium sp.]HQS54198.1 spheroidene monooxygenase [Sediminibacterium sp.]
MICSITIVRYPNWLGWAGFLSMALFRLPLLLNQQIGFWKLMGTGKNGSFDKTPDLAQWAILVIDPLQNTQELNQGPSGVEEETTYLQNRYGRFIAAWWRFFKCETWTIVLEPIEGHGLWDGKQPFGPVPIKSEYEGPIAILTRATIKLNKLKDFWGNVDKVANRMAGAPGFQTSFGIGEIPWIKQATFSIWTSKAAMKAFAYQMHEHATVIAKTRKEKWYSEDLFMRFRPLFSFGKVKGVDPLKQNP